MSYSVCTVRIRPIRAEGLRSEYGEVENPLLVAQVLPWKTTRKTKPLPAGGSNPSWKGTRTHLDLPYFGHPLPGVRAYVALMVMDKPAAPTIPESDTDEDEREDEDSDDDLKAEMARNDPPKFVGRADFDLRRYLQQRHDIHTIRLKLQDKRGNDSGEIVCTLQFVLTGVIRLTVLSGSRLKNNVKQYPDQEPYVEAHLVPGKGKKKRTNTKQGENPRWGDYTRQPSLVGFASLGLFKGNEQPRRRRRQPNILDFKFKDDDRSQIPRIIVSVKDKMDTALKQENAEKRSKEQISKIENRIRRLKSRRIHQNEMLRAEKEAARSAGGGGWFGRRKNRPAPTEEEIAEVPLSDEEKALVDRLAAKLREESDEKPDTSGQPDRLIGIGSIDVRSVLNYDGIREAKTFTVNLVDENNLETGTLTCMLEFDNYAFDRSKKVLKMPSFEDFTWEAALEMDGKQLARELYKIYLYSEIQMEVLAPDFVLRTANDTGLPKTLIFGGFVGFALFVLATIWFGLGTRTLSYSVGVLYPVYQSYKALEQRSNEMNQQWLTYWIVYGFINILEGTALRPITFLYPTLFYVFKMMILLWLVNPSQLGATFIYHILIAPFMRRHESQIDRALSAFNATAKEAVKDMAGIYDQLEEEMLMMQIDTHVAEYSNSVVNSEDPFGIVTAAKTAKRLSKKRARSPKGTRIFVGIQDQNDSKKTLLIKPNMSWDDVCLIAANTVGIADDVELYMIVSDSEIVVNDVSEIQNDDLLFVRAVVF